jgi:hypothetical protein
MFLLSVQRRLNGHVNTATPHQTPLCQSGTVLAVVLGLDAFHPEIPRAEADGSFQARSCFHSAKSIASGTL